MRYLDILGEAHSTAIICEPVPLTFGKGADAEYACGRDYTLLPRDWGHIGINVCHYCFDGALYSALVRRFKQHHYGRALERKDEAKAAVHDPRVLMLKEWVAST